MWNPYGAVGAKREKILHSFFIYNSYQWYWGRLSSKIWFIPIFRNYPYCHTTLNARENHVLPMKMCFNSKKGMDEIMSDFTRSDIHQNHECMAKFEWLICCLRKSKQKIKWKEREADWTTLVYIPRSHDLWKRVLTARILGMKSGVISCNWAYLKITKVVNVWSNSNDCYVVWGKVSRRSSGRREMPIEPHRCTYLDLMTYENMF